MGLIKKIVILLALGFLVVACEKEAPVTPTSTGPFSPIFPGSTYITVPNYPYTVSIGNNDSAQFIMHGMGFWDSTSNKYIDTVDLAPVNPTFKWNSTGQQYVMVAVSSKKILINMDTYAIADPRSIVWAWNSGMKKGKEGNILFNDGCDVINGALQYGQQPHNLNYDSTYYWAVWAWDDNAINIIYSSRQIRFHVY